MIYDKVANFPYPIFSLKSNSYKNNEFLFNLRLNADNDDYIFKVECNIESEFIKNLLEEGKAKLVLIIQATDNQSITLDYPIIKDIKISKSRMSLEKRPKFQLIILSNEEINFENNKELNEFYDEYKSNISVSKYALLGFSNVEIFDSRIVNPNELFAKKKITTLKTPIKITLGPDTIVINYKDNNVLFDDLGKKELNYLYFYMGIEQALERFIRTYSDKINDEVILDNMEIPDDILDTKLYNLMINKGIKTLDYDNLDEVINTITNNMLPKFSNAIRELYSDEN